MGYTHHDKISGETGVYTGTKGNEVQIASSTGYLMQAGTKVTASATELNKLDGVSVTAAEMDYRILSVDMNVGSGVSRAGSVCTVSPVNGVIAAAYSVINGSIKTADTKLYITNNAGSAAGTITIAKSSAAWTTDSAVIVASNAVVTAGGKIMVRSNGSSTLTAGAEIVMLLNIT